MLKLPKKKHKTVVKSHLFPKCNKNDVTDIMKVVNTFRGENYKNIMRFIDEVTPQGLCIILHSLRRWYSSQSAGSAYKILRYHNALSKVMDYSAPIGIYRGFKVKKDNPILENIKKGDIIKIPVTRNGSNSSWAETIKVANKFSGSNKEKTGIVIKLVSNKNVKVFIAPPYKTKKWFNLLYEKTMGRSFRFKEKEYGINGTPLEVQIVKVK